MVNTDDCMLYARSLSTKGYARIYLKNDKTGKWGTKQLHRQLYIAEKGDIPDGLVIDHLCRHRACINVDHMEPVTNTENLNRGDRPSVYGTHCNNGHLLSTYGFTVLKSGSKRCRECARIKSNIWYHKNKDYVNAKQRLRYHSRKAA